MGLRFAFVCVLMFCASSVFGEADAFEAQGVSQAEGEIQAGESARPATDVEWKPLFGAQKGTPSRKRLTATRLVNATTLRDDTQAGQFFLGRARALPTNLTQESVRRTAAFGRRNLNSSMTEHPVLNDESERAQRVRPSETVQPRLERRRGGRDASRIRPGDADVARRGDLIVPGDAPIGTVAEGITALSDRSQSPLPIRTGTASITGQNDPGIAASKNFVTVVGYNRISFYDKSNLSPLQGKDGASFASNISAIDLFRPIWDPSNPENVNTFLNLPSNLPCDPFVEPETDPDATKYCLDDFYDLRVAYDRTRERFWIVGLARNSEARGRDKDLSVLQGRRSVVIAAVSVTEDPRDGFYLYWWPAAIESGYCNNTSGEKCVGAREYRPGDHGDYPTLAITQDYVMVGVVVANAIDQKINENSGHRYAAMHVLRADALADGAQSCPDPCSWSYWHIPAPGGGRVTGVVYPARPVVGKIAPKAFWVRQWGDRLLIYAIQRPKPGVYPPIFSAQVLFKRTEPTGISNALQGVNDAPLPGTDERMTLRNLGGHTVSAFFRDNQIYTVMQDCIQWRASQEECSTSIRLVRVEVSPMMFLNEGDAPAWADPLSHSLENGAGSRYLDRTFGLRGPGDESDAVVYYGNPAVTVNVRGDIGVVYMRAGKTVYPEARYSIYPRDGDDILSSRLMAKGSRISRMNFDTGGAELDPDGETFWFAHAYSDANGATERFAIAAVKP